MGFKPVENRGRRTRHRGPILIHAAQKEERHQIEPILGQVALQTSRRYSEIKDLYARHRAIGSIVGTADIVDCVGSMRSPWFFGPWGFVLANPRWCDPIPYKGQLSLFEVPNEVTSEVRFRTPEANRYRR